MSPMVCDSPIESKLSFTGFIGTVTVSVKDQGMQTVRALVVAQAWNLPTLGPQFVKYHPIIPVMI
jgi:uncharacterized protein (DUF302 family)